MISLVYILGLASSNLLPPLLKFVYRLQLVERGVPNISTVDDFGPISKWVYAVIHARPFGSTRIVT